MAPPPSAELVLQDEVQQSSLVHLLSNSLILCHTAPYLPGADLLALGATCRTLHYLIHQNPQVFRYLDLRSLKSAQFDIAGIDHGGETWRNVQLDENLTEDDFFSGPLRGVFSSLRRAHLLSDVQVLVLDGLAVTADLVHEILTDASYSVRILSLRECDHLNGNKLRGALQYACRPSRPAGTPRLKGLYVFGKKDVSLDLTSSTGEAAVAAAWNARGQKALVAGGRPSSHDAMGDEPWYGRRGWQFPDGAATGGGGNWAQTLLACDGLIAFDAVLCRGPRHLNSPAWGTADIDALNRASSSPNPGAPHWAVAQFSLEGCAGCGSAPEGWTVWGADNTAATGSREDGDEGRTNPDIGRFPLLPPPPLHSPGIKAAMRPAGQPLNPRNLTASSGPGKARFVARCAPCLGDRYCTACHRWWCEACYLGPLPAVRPQFEGRGVHLSRVSKSCWECGMNCPDCIGATQRTCRICGGGYCIIHNEGSNLLHCDCRPPERPAAQGGHLPLTTGADVVYRVFEPRTEDTRALLGAV